MKEKNSKFGLAEIVVVLALAVLLGSLGVSSGVLHASSPPGNPSSSQYEELLRQIDHRDEGAHAIVRQFAEGR